jgi:hypothetical protein
MQNIYHNYEDKNIKEVYEIVFADGRRDLYWTGDGISSTEYAAMRYKNKQAAIDIAKKLKEIHEIQWGQTTKIVIGIIDLVENVYIREEEVR